MSETPATLLHRIPPAAATVFLGLPGILAEVVALRCEQAQASRHARPGGADRAEVGPGEAAPDCGPPVPLPWVVDRDPVLPEDVESRAYPPGSVGRARRDVVFSRVARRTPLVVPGGGLHPEQPWVHDATHQILADDAARTPAAYYPDGTGTPRPPGAAPPPGKRGELWEREELWQPGEREAMAAWARASPWSEACEDVAIPGAGRRSGRRTADGRSGRRTAQGSRGPQGRGTAEGLPADLQARMDLVVLTVDALSPTEWDLPMAPQTPVLLVVRRASGEVACLGGCVWAERPCTVCLLAEAAARETDAVQGPPPPTEPAGAQAASCPPDAARPTPGLPAPPPRACVCRLGADPPSAAIEDGSGVRSRQAR